MTGVAIVADAAGPEQIRAGFTAALTAADDHTSHIDGLARLLSEAADWYESLQMAGTTVAHLRDAATALTAGSGHLDAGSERLQAAAGDFEARDGQVAAAVADAGNLMDAAGYGESFTLAASSGTPTSTDGNDSMSTASTTGAGDDPGPRSVRIKSDETEPFDVVVTPSAGTVRIDLAAGDPEDSDEYESPFVVLDEAAVAALSDAAAVMEAAEKQARAAHRKLDVALDRLERRRDTLQNKPYESPQATAILDELRELDDHKGQLFKRLRRQARSQLGTEQLKAFHDLESQLAPGTDWSPIRAAQRQVMAEAGVAAEDPFFADQAEHDDLVGRCADLRRQLQAVPLVPLTAKEQAELDRITSEITETEAALAAQGDDRELADGTIATQDGSGLAWRTTVRDGATVTHRLAAAADDTDVPELTGGQLRQVIRAVTHAWEQAR
ncbi:hypothetical protein [Actinoplanes sp. G11-F43]|uniref:hypothetical protein n=1 Tax=Actinoplanes sp. G11-F43 TaxID=3424130 RepID=UPI003D32A8A4